MKVLHLTYSLEYGGIETMLVNIINEQINSVEVFLICINDNVEKSLTGKINQKIKCIYIGRRRGTKNPIDIMNLNFKIHQIKPDVIHVHHPSIIRYLFRPFLSGKIVITMHAIPRDFDYPYLPKYDAVYAISNSVKNELDAHTINSVVVYNGIHPQIFKKRRFVNSSNSNYNIVQVGRLVVRNKGQDLSVRAIKMLIDRGYADISLTLIGDGPDKNMLLELIGNLGIDNYVQVVGKKDQDYISEHLRDYSLFIQPSRREGFGLTVAEAMASKVPVLVSDQQGPMELIQHGIYGLYFKTENVEDLCEKIICSRHKTNMDMIEKAYTYILNNFDVKLTASNYLKEYKKILV